MKKLFFMLLCAASLALVGCDDLTPKITIDDYCGTYNFSAGGTGKIPVTGSVTISKVDDTQLDIDMSDVDSYFTSPVRATMFSDGTVLITAQDLDSTTTATKYDVAFYPLGSDSTRTAQMALVIKMNKDGKIAIASKSPAIGCCLYSKVKEDMTIVGDGTLVKAFGFNLEKAK